jgi:chorismate dehydratase
MFFSRPQSSVLSPESCLVRLGGVSFLNAKPLLYGLEAHSQTLSVSLDVPSRLIDGLRSGAFDVALLPVIDYQKMEGLNIVPSGGIGCNGPTLTVRIFSRVPIERIEALACDPDSHTSVALAQIILAERWGIHPRLVAPGSAQAQLLIGDKVVCEEPAGMEYQLDLGQAWKELTDMPFVFAVWSARAGIELGSLPQRLEEAKQNGLAHLDQIIARDAVPRGWPAKLAGQYLGENLKFDVGPAQLAAITRFHELAWRHRLIAAPPRPLVIY